MTRHALAHHGVPERDQRLSGGRRRQVLSNAGLIVVCAVVAAGLAVVNSATPPHRDPSTRSFVVRLLGAADLGAVNRNLTHIGARVRVVMATAACRDAPASSDEQVSGISRHSIAVDQVSPGHTRVVVASRRGLTGRSFVVDGPAPRCVPAA